MAKRRLWEGGRSHRGGVGNVRENINVYPVCFCRKCECKNLCHNPLESARCVCVLYLHEQLSDPNYVVHHLRKVPACQRAGFLPWNTVASAIEISTKPCDITMRACHMINTGGLKQLSRTSWMRIDFFFFHVSFGPPHFHPGTQSSTHHITFSSLKAILHKL